MISSSLVSASFCRCAITSSALISSRRRATPTLLSSISFPITSDSSRDSLLAESVSLARDSTFSVRDINSLSLALIILPLSSASDPIELICFSWPTSCIFMSSSCLVKSSFSSSLSFNEVLSLAFRSAMTASASQKALWSFSTNSTPLRASNSDR